MMFLFSCYAVAYICTLVIDVGEEPELNKLRLVPYVAAFGYSLFTWQEVALAISFAGLVVNAIALVPFVRAWGLIRLVSMTYAFTAMFITIVPALQTYVHQIATWLSYRQDEIFWGAIILVALGHILRGNFNFMSILFLSLFAAFVVALLPSLILEVIRYILHAGTDTLVLGTFLIVFLVTSFMNITHGGFARSAFAFTMTGQSASTNIQLYRKDGTDVYFYNATSQGHKNEGWKNKQKSGYTLISSVPVHNVQHAYKTIDGKLGKFKTKKGNGRHYKLEDETLARDVMNLL